MNLIPTQTNHDVPEASGPSRKGGIGSSPIRRCLNVRMRVAHSPGAYRARRPMGGARWN